jgi:spore maturation protein CgeB
VEILENNLRSLQSLGPEFARVLSESAQRGLRGERELSPARSGHLQVVGLESAYNPHREYELRVAEQLPRLSGVPLVVGFLSGAHLEILLQSLAEIDLLVMDVGLFLRALAGAPLGFEAGRLRQVFLFDEPNQVFGVFSRLDAPVTNDRTLVLNPRYLEEVKGSLGRFKLWQRHVFATKPTLLFVSPILGGSYNICRYLYLAAQDLGYPAVFLDNSPQRARLAAVKEGKDPAAIQGFLQDLSDGALAAIVDHRVDVLVGVSQSPLPEKLVHKARQMGVLCVYWFIENHRLFRYYKDIIQRYDRFLVFQKAGFLETLREMGHRQADYLPVAAMPSIHRPLALCADERLAYGSEVSFMGSAYGNRVLFFERLVPALRQSFKLWGVGWEDSPALNGYFHQSPGAYLADETIVKIYNASAINLNLHSDERDEARRDYVNPRTFEIPSCGGFQLVDQRDELSSLFAADEVITYDTLEELGERIGYFLAHPDERAEIAARARARVLKEHTYALRLEQMLESLNPRRSG